MSHRVHITRATKLQADVWGHSMGAQRRTSTAGREDVARELWASMFRGNWLLFSANVVLYLAQAIITLAFAYILKQTFDAVKWLPC